MEFGPIWIVNHYRNWAILVHFENFIQSKGKMRYDVDVPHGSSVRQKLDQILETESGYPREHIFFSVVDCICYEWESMIMD